MLLIWQERCFPHSTIVSGERPCYHLPALQVPDQNLAVLRARDELLVVLRERQGRNSSPVSFQNSLLTAYNCFLARGHIPDANPSIRCASGKASPIMRESDRRYKPARVSLFLI